MTEMRVFAFDLDGTLSVYPEQLGTLMRSLSAAGHHVVVLTGTQTYADRERQLRGLGLADSYNELVVVPGPTVADVAQQKGDYCRDHAVAVLVDDRADYCAAAKAAGALALMVT